MREKTTMTEFLARWHAIVNYRTDNGTVAVDHHLEEIKDLHDLVEQGPHWDTIEKIEIVRIDHCTSDKLTVEQDRELVESWKRQGIWDVVQRLLRPE
jgi:hypothetical protein